MSFADLSAAMSGIVFATIGEPVTLFQEGQAPLALTGIFLAEHESVDVQSGVPVSSVQPVLELRERDLPEGVDEGDRVLVQGRLYLVVDVRPDGYGTYKLLLHKAGRNAG